MLSTKKLLNLYSVGITRLESCFWLMIIIEKHWGKFQPLQSIRYNFVFPEGQ